MPGNFRQVFRVDHHHHIVFPFQCFLSFPATVDQNCVIQLQQIFTAHHGRLLLKVSDEILVQLASTKRLPDFILGERATFAIVVLDPEFIRAKFRDGIRAVPYHNIP
jgi:hypothetical protein